MKIVCVGRNYAAHAKEMNSPLTQDPVIFIKPETALLPTGQNFEYPSFSENIHFECEVFFRIGKKGKNVAASEAWDIIDGVGLGIDFTARDIQENAKKEGLPWEKAKGFDQSAAVSEIFPLNILPDRDKINFKLMVNEVDRQFGITSDYIFKIPQLIAHISRYFTLNSNDLIFTGTPEGIGPVKPGDHLRGFLENKPVLDFSIL
jgi:2-keto-4-pentenoate hydratase/2-oxohepta-3-ene-1,7-dioic acid hydratase in catechol pathway